MDTILSIRPGLGGRSWPRLLLALGFAAAPGAARPQTSPSLQALVDAASPGDVIVVTGQRDSDYAVIYDRLTLQGDAVLRRVAEIPNEKAIVVANDGLTVQGLTFVDALVDDDNGAGIRMQGGVYAVSAATFRNNQNGIMGSASELRITDSVFDGNGACISACAHGIYMTSGGLLSVNRSLFRNTREGHGIKSRADRTEVRHSTFEAGAESFQIEAPNGGILIADDITASQGAQTGNDVLIAYGREGITKALNTVAITRARLTCQGGGTAIQVIGATSVAIHDVDVVGCGTFYEGPAANMLDNTLDGRPYGPQSPPAATDPVLDAIPISGTWQRFFPAAPLEIHTQAQSYSGGGVAEGKLYVLGGGHNNGMNDAVAVLDLTRFSTTGWVEPFASTAASLGVSDADYAAIGAELNARYLPQMPGMFQRSGEIGRLSVHTYDGIVPAEGGFYLFAGENPYDNAGQPPPAWPTRTPTIARYVFGLGWQFISPSLTAGTSDAGRVAATLDSVDANLVWVIQDWGLYRFDLMTQTLTDTGLSAPNWSTEGWLESCDGELYVGGGLSSARFSGYREGRGWLDHGTLPFQDSSHGSVACAAGSLYGYERGTLWRWSPGGWSVVATGGPPVGSHTYGRFGYDTIHGLFYLVDVVGGEWQAWFVRPFGARISTRYYAVTPCRLVDTRGPSGASGGPRLAAGTARPFPLAGRCNVPLDAEAVAAIVTVTQATEPGHLRLYPAGASVPLASSINFLASRARANNGLFALGSSGQVAARCDLTPGSTGGAHLVLDVFGYFK